MTRAKFTLTRIERTLQQRADRNPDGSYGPTYTVEMQTLVFNPVYPSNDPDGENAKFWAATPSGEIKLGVVNAAAVEHFDLGRDYYVDFHPVQEHF